MGTDISCLAKGVIRVYRRIFFFFAVVSFILSDKLTPRALAENGEGC